MGKHSNTDTQFNLVQLYLCNWGFPGGTVVKNMPANAGDTGDMGLNLGQEDPLSRKWQPSPRRIPWTEEPDGL